MGDKPQTTPEPGFDLIGRYCPERSRPASEPGGMECGRCGCIFIGEDWHQLCRVCVELTAAEIAKEQQL